MISIYNDFSEIENDVKKKVSPILYKYRIWNNDFHKKILTDNLIWFAHPKELNDPYDIRTPVRFDYNEVNHPSFFKKLKYFTKKAFPNVDETSIEFRTLCENKFDLIKKNPKAHFEENYLSLRESSIYNCVGVFSLSQTELDETMWAHYGGNFSGFCVGFDSIALLKEFSKKCKFGIVEYEDEPPLHSFIRDFDENQKDEMYFKHTKWSNEKEFRLLTLDISKDNSREMKFNKEVLKEIVIGSQTDKKNLDLIIQILKHKYDSKVSLSKVETNISTYGLSKTVLNY